MHKLSPRLDAIGNTLADYAKTAQKTAQAFDELERQNKKMSVIQRAPRSPPGLLNKAYGITAFVKTIFNNVLVTIDGCVKDVLVMR